MKRTLLIVTMLMLVTPALAGVTITATQEGTAGPVRFSYSSDVNVRAFAFDINVDAGATITGISDYNTGDTNGYGIFPGTFRDFFNATSPNWVDPCYTPVAPSGDPGAKPGLGTHEITVELGSLGVDLATIRSGTLFKIQVTSGGQADCNMTVTANDIRGTMVGDDGNAIAYSLPGSTKVTTAIPCIDIPAIVGGSMTDANNAITTAGLTVGTISYNCSETVAAGLVMSQDTGCVAAGTAVNYVVSTGPCCTNIPAILGNTMTDANNAITGAGLTVGTKTYECNNTYAKNLVCRQDTGCVAPGTAVNYVVSLGSAPGMPATITVPTTDADGKYNVTWTAPAGGGATSYQLEDSCNTSTWKQVYTGTALTYAVKVGGGTWSYRVKATNACGSSAWKTGSNTCVVSDCMKSTAPAAEYTAWKAWRYPACWCYKKQCKGDINGGSFGGKPVTSVDLTTFSAAFNLPDADLALVTNGVCADLNHGAFGGKRVTSADLTIFSANFNVVEASVLCCDTASPAGDCTLVTADKFNFWTVP